VAILIPPPVLQEEGAILDLPVMAHVGQQFVGADLAGIEAGQEVSRIVQAHGAVFADDVAIDAQGDLTAREVQLLADVLGIL
jgi:hypothetical protein